MITSKEYKCRICGETEKVETNHYGEIYSSCRICGNNVRSCVEATPKVDATAILTSYRYDISNPEDRLRYEELTSQMRVYALTKHEEISLDAIKHSFKWRQIEANLNGKVMPIYNHEQFKGQYCSAGIRLYDWCEAIFENKNIKVGYYLTQRRRAE